MICNHPSIRKLSLKTSFRGSPSEKEAAKLADILVKFYELDLTEYCENVKTRRNPSSLKLLKSMISASAGGSSKLKKLSLSNFDETLHSEVLGEARERFAVDIVDDTSSVSFVSRNKRNGKMCLEMGENFSPISRHFWV